MRNLSANAQLCISCKAPTVNLRSQNWSQADSESQVNWQPDEGHVGHYEVLYG